LYSLAGVSTLRIKIEILLDRKN